MTFLDPLFLFGLLGASVPLVIHLLSRRTARRQKFSTLEFLRDLQRKSMRRLRVKQWLLLLLRMAIIAAVAMAMARPTLTGVTTPGGRGATSVAIVIDGSFSMRAPAGGEGDGGSRFEAARTRAVGLLESLETGDEVLLLAPGGSGVGRPTGLRDHRLAAERLGAARPGLGAVDLPAAIRDAVRALEGARHLRREIHVVSDFQGSAWAAADAPELPDATSLFLHSVGEAGRASNAWVEAVDFSGQILERGVPIEIRTAVSASPAFEARTVEVELEIDGITADRRRVDVAPGSRLALTFRETFAEDGLHLGRIRLREAEGPEADDARHFTMRTERAVPVRLVAGSEAARRYLEAALAPSGAVAGSFAVLPGAPRDLETVSRESEAVVILADLERLSAAELSGLKAYLSEGGGLLVFPGPRTDAADWSRSFLPKLLPGTLADASPPPEPFRIAEVDPAHPLLALFRGGEGGLADVRFGRTLRFLPEAGTSVLATYSTGDPALVESTLLPGRVLFFTSTLDPSWSDLPLTGAFVPLVHEAVRYLSETSRGAARSLDVGEGTVVRVASVPEGGGVTLLPPDGEPRTVALEAVAGAYAIELPEADRPGFWIFRSGGGDTLAALAADVPVRESDPALLDAEELEARRGAARGAVLTDADEVLRAVREDRVGREIGRWFLWAAALFLVGEMALAARFRTEGQIA